MSSGFDFDVTRVNFTGLDAGETAFQTAFNDLVTELENLENKLNTKTALWNGSAKTAYEAARKTWQEEANDLAAMVRMMAQNINITNMNMQEVERINTQLFGG